MLSNMTLTFSGDSLQGLVALGSQFHIIVNKKFVKLRSCLHAVVPFQFGKKRMSVA